MVGITALGMLDSSGEERIVGVSLLRIASAFVLCCSTCYSFTIANGVPISFRLLLHKNVRHRSFLPFGNYVTRHNASRREDLQVNSVGDMSYESRFDQN